MDKSHLELQLMRSVSVAEFVKFAAQLWAPQGREIAAACPAPVVLLIGAGASRSSPVNLPVMSEFMNSFIDQHYKVIVPPGVADHLIERWESGASLLAAVIADLATVLDRRPDLEQLLCFLQMIKGRDYEGLVFPSSVSTQQLQQVLAKWKGRGRHAHEIHKLLLYRLFDAYSGVDAVKAARLYAPILAMLREYLTTQQRIDRPLLPVVTTNYDLTIETSAAVSRNKEAYVKQWRASEFDTALLAQMPRTTIVDGFLRQHGEWIWQPSVHYRGDGQAINPRTGEPALLVSPNRYLDESFWNDPDAELSVLYFKIHGSLNWVYTNSVIAKLDRDDWLWHREDLSFYHILRSMAWPDPPNFIPFLWEPGNKEWFTNAYQQIAYECLAQLLAVAKVFIFVGYSFRDQHLLALLKRALQQNTTLTIMTVDPCDTFFPDLMAILDSKRFVHLHCALSDAVSVLSDALMQVTR